MTWQPISTAPRDGVSLILACADDVGPYIVYFDRFNEGGKGGWRDSAFGDICHPTHWMPLPDPPKETA